MDACTSGGSIDRRGLIDPANVAISRLFPTPIASIAHPDRVALNAALRDTILARAAADRGVSHSNEGGWQSTDDFVAWSGDAGHTLERFGQNLANEMSAILMPDGALIEADLEFSHTAWANVNQAGDFNMLHGHPGSYWSGVYYVDDGRTEGAEDVGGDIQFTDPRGLMPSLFNPALRMRVAGCLSAGLSHIVTPVSGTFLMFPSWLLHSVSRYRGTRPRVSVAFNFWV